MERLQEIFAKNLKENRQKRGLSQEKLVELVNISPLWLPIPLPKN
jgi:transcriptional regulator with XRE-family HTH domain